MFLRKAFLSAYRRGKFVYVIPIEYINGIFELLAFQILKNSKKYFTFSLTKELKLENLFKLYSNYASNQDYELIQKTKTNRRLQVFNKNNRSIMWTNSNSLKNVAQLIQSNSNKSKLDGVCMGSRSGEEMTILERFLGKGANVIGVEITENAKTLPNTIIADFHKLPKQMANKFDFVYSNSHDQSNNPKLAFNEWIKVLKPGGLLVLEHCRSHGRSLAGKQDPFGIETELVPFVLMSWFTSKLNLVGIYTPTNGYDSAHRFFVFSKKE
jgi:SAM-dependent methyltransferase